MIRQVLASAAAMAATVAPATAQTPPTLDLTCPGTGTGRQMVKNYLKDDKNDPAYVPRQTRIEGIARVKLRGDTAEIMLPPGLSVLGDWFKVKKLAVTDTEISGSVQVALLTSAKLTIDRVGGTLSLRSDNGNFAGRCTAADPGARAF